MVKLHLYEQILFSTFERIPYKNCKFDKTIGKNELNIVNEYDKWRLLVS
jgi:hypothetical protein